ncbi:MAG: glycosyltransferase family 4 protein [Phycisphaera sp. RhM]|nr:glycosyltransferase family 4 protein [Phycisphaera sp. RhM]
MMALPKVLLLTGSPPGDNGVGQIIVKEICRNYPQDRVVCFATLSRHEQWEKPAEFKDLAVRIGVKRYEHRIQPMPGPVGATVAMAAYWGMFRRHCRHLTCDAVEFGREHQCEILFSILESATNIQITDAVARGIGIPKRVLVWDAPDYIATHLGQMPLNVSAISSAFQKAVKNADALAVVSEPMARLYRQQFGLESVILRHAAPPAEPSFESQSDDSTCERDPIVIAFAGSVSARPQLDVLQRALDLMHWKIGGREVRLDLYGMRFVLESRGPRNVRYCGYRSVAETVEALCKTADVLFMPQPFESELASFTELSFPTKLSTYFAAGHPILLLSPPVSSLGEFFQECPFGVWCQEMEPSKVAEAIEKIVTDKQVRATALQNIRQQLEGAFSQNFFREQLHRFLAPANTVA